MTTLNGHAAELYTMLRARKADLERELAAVNAILTFEPVAEAAGTPAPVSVVDVSPPEPVTPRVHPHRARAGMQAAKGLCFRCDTPTVKGKRLCRHHLRLARA